MKHNIMNSLESESLIQEDIERGKATDENIARYVASLKAVNEEYFRAGLQMSQFDDYELELLYAQHRESLLESLEGANEDEFNDGEWTEKAELMGIYKAYSKAYYDNNVYQLEM